MGHGGGGEEEEEINVFIITPYSGKSKKPALCDRERSIERRH